jgi:DNA-binding NarL/FixJ family response regulator
MGDPLNSETGTAPLRILVVDDHERLRKTVCEVLTSHPEFEVVCDVADGAEALKKTIELQPDIVIMDFSMPNMGGIEAAVKIRQAVPGTQVVFLSQHIAPSIVQMALATGARGYVAKSNIGDELVKAITMVARGLVFVSRDAK